jgi:hypothetical protein
VCALQQAPSQPRTWDAGLAAELQGDAPRLVRRVPVGDDHQQLLPRHGGSGVRLEHHAHLLPGAGRDLAQRRFQQEGPQRQLLHRRGGRRALLVRWRVQV